MANTFPGNWPLTAPDIATSLSPGGIAVDADDLMTETTSEAQNLQQDLTNRLIELPGSNLDFGPNNTRGVGIMMYLSGSTSDLAGIPGRIDAEFEQDFRVTQSATTLVQQADGSYLISSEIQTVAGVLGLSWAWSQSGIAPLPLAA